MIEARRRQLSGLQSDHANHTGLWLDRYLPKQIKRGEKLEANQAKPLVTMMDQAARLAISDAYQQFYPRWKQSLFDLGAQCREAKVLGRMVVGLGDESVLETSVALHHTYGVPYIPGSALKGLAARFVRERLAGVTDWGDWKVEDERKTWVAGRGYRTIFGDTANAGYISFFDALLVVPESGPIPQALYPDVITVHHPKYYQGEKDAAPADWDSPTPVPFLSATGSYLIALSGPAAWVDATFAILGHALRELGVGAKTSSGYGRMEVGEMLVRKLTPKEQAEQAKAAAEAQVKQFSLHSQQHMMKPVQSIAGAGVIMQLKNPPKGLTLRFWLPEEAFQGRPAPSGDTKCSLHELIEHDGEWLLRLEWPMKQRKGEPL
ncbi:MAG: type III-B CRISPR module RAMP protein Cmr6 [Oscillochloris sp.]|nr:type III-B CRISPR module RAMP protein Cmr6 [Oscillochloris sp.]